MGVRHVLKAEPPDLILSGVNRGGNMAEDVTYSGTIAGAFEGTILGIRSIALSQAFGFEPGKGVRWQTAIAHAPGLIRKLLATEWPPSTTMNINFPDREPNEVAGVSVTSQGRRDPGLAAHRRATGYLGQSLLLAGLRAAPLGGIRGQRSARRLCRADFRHAALPGSDPSRFAPNA